ncbi:hypothetical protein [Paenibacillus sp. MMS20-IR301]|uniref:hypothetical protein n=1 Tax=Paenibacillus sp. MMS20-IR301 TaxID=2895946 RepID=UPI0028EFE3F4|nr:hypothetical protein [Paenibacillus sp. MMS20-IR301]WNS41722.1 hypothetical protein LOS79_22245 [Paenibacillus sp. MMS20-IR301]
MKNIQQQNVGMLFAGSFLALTASRIIESNGSNLIDFSQGLLTGIGIAGMVVSLLVYGRYQKQSR